MSEVYDAETTPVSRKNIPFTKNECIELQERAREAGLSITNLIRREMGYPLLTKVRNNWRRHD